MKKKLFIFFTMALSLSIAGCQKNDSNLVSVNENVENEINNITLSETVEITESGTYQLTGTIADGMVYVDCQDEVRLILDSVDITNTTGPAIYINSSNKTIIELADESVNTLTDGSEYNTDSNDDTIGKGTISSNGDITICGEGSVEINGNYKHAVSAEGSICVQSGSITVNDAIKDCIHAEEVAQIDGGSITGQSQDEGIEGKTSVIINDGYIDVACTDDCINAGENITINSGTIYLTSLKGDAIDCNGNKEGCITINGGLVIANGGDAPEGGLDTDNAAVVINGGVVIASGSVNSPISENSAQPSIVYGSFTETAAIGLLDESGKTVFAFCPTYSDTTLIISAPSLKVGKTYTIFTGGTIAGAGDAYGYYSDGTYSDGTEVLTVTAESVVVEAGGSSKGMSQGPGMGGFDIEGMPDMENMPDPENMPDMENMPDFEQMPMDGTRPEPPEGMTRPNDGQKPNN